MSNIVNFLERMGQDAKLRHADRVVLEQALNGAGITGQQWSNLVNADDRQREILLGAKSNVCAIIHAVDEDEDAPPSK